MLQLHEKRWRLEIFTVIFKIFNMFFFLILTKKRLIAHSLQTYDYVLTLEIQ